MFMRNRAVVIGALVSAVLGTAIVVGVLIAGHPRSSKKSAVPTVQHSVDPDISVTDAARILGVAESLARQHDADALCNMGGSVGICQAILDTVGGIASVPFDQPQVVRSYMFPGKTCANGYGTLGGRILVVKGVDAEGRGFVTDFLVMRWKGSLVPYNPVYWSDFKMQQPGAIAILQRRRRLRRDRGRPRQE